MNEDFPYILTGEVDKIGHPVIRHDPKLKNKVPDFLIHTPGSRENLIILEVKPIAARINDIKNDLEKLKNFTASQETKYYRGILLIYGYHYKRDKEWIIQNLKIEGSSKTVIFYHREAGENVVQVFP